MFKNEGMLIVQGGYGNWHTDSLRSSSHKEVYLQLGGIGQEVSIVQFPMNRVGRSKMQRSVFWKTHQKMTIATRRAASPARHSAPTTTGMMIAKRIAVVKKVLGSSGMGARIIELSTTCRGMQYILMHT